MNNTENIELQLQLKRGTAAEWEEINPILSEGEPGYEKDTKKIKIGNGINKWTEIPYIFLPSDFSQTDTEAIDFIKNKPIKNSKGDFSFVTNYYSIIPEWDANELDYSPNSKYYDEKYCIYNGTCYYCIKKPNVANILPTNEQYWKQIDISTLLIENIANGVASTAIGNNSIAKGDFSFASGNQVIAEGEASIAMGHKTQALAKRSHAEGARTTAEAVGAHAEGDNTHAIGAGSHAEGGYTFAEGDYSHAEGAGNNYKGAGEKLRAIGQGAHAEGIITIAGGIASHSEGYKNKVTMLKEVASSVSINKLQEIYFDPGLDAGASFSKGEIVKYITINDSTGEESVKLYYCLNDLDFYNDINYIDITPIFNLNDKFYILISNIPGSQGAHAEGYETEATNMGAHSEGKLTKAFGIGSHAEGYGTIDDLVEAHSDGSHAEGKGTKSTGIGSHSEGVRTQATAVAAHAEGYETIASGLYAHTEGLSNKATGLYAHSEGQFCEASDSTTHAQGKGTVADKPLVTAIGKYNTRGRGCILVAGKGSNDTNRSDAFVLTWGGQGQFNSGTSSSIGADYAEYLEWLDGNPNKEDRTGHFVSLINDKIQIAKSIDDIIGVVSATPAVIGDSRDLEWQGKYVTDIFGRIQYKDVTIEEIIKNENEEEVINSYIEKQPILNAEYDSSKKYIPRSERPEWAPIGFLGKLIVIDDGTCKPGEKCSCNDNGIATKGNKYRVLKRLDNSHIQILANFL